MNRRVGVSELRRRPMQIVREAQDSPEGITLTYRGAPVAVIGGWIAPRERPPDLETELNSDRPGADHGVLGGAAGLGGGWPAGDTEPQAPDADALLDSASWGLWEGLTQAQRRALIRAVQEQSSGAVGEAICQSRSGEQTEEGDESKA